MKHLRLFKTDAEYNLATLELPNVSYVNESNVVYYNPSIEIPEIVLEDNTIYVYLPGYESESPYVIQLLGYADSSKVESVYVDNNLHDTDYSYSVYDEYWLHEVAPRKEHEIKIKLKSDVINSGDIYFTSDLYNKVIFNKFESIDQWFLNQLNTTEVVFDKCVLNKIDTDGFVQSNIVFNDVVFTESDLSAGFQFSESVKSVIFNNVTFSENTSLGSMFSGSYIHTIDFTNTDLSKVTDMNFMIYEMYHTDGIVLKMSSPLNENVTVRGMWGTEGGLPNPGTFYYNSEYDYSKLLALLPSTWTAIPCTLVNGVLIPN